MDQRYITRFRLPERGYVNASPVVLAAGALLQDTRLPRLVVQLKFKNISPHTIAALQVIIRCFRADGAEREGLPFRYDNLRVQRGQSFGTYTAIVLPCTDAHSFSVTLGSVFYRDGTRWDIPDGGAWTCLPPFLPLEEVLTDQALLQLCHEKLPFAKYGYAAPADLWYCPCGGVNRNGEAACHRCSQPRSAVVQYATPEGLTALRQAVLAEQEARRARKEAAALEAKARAAAFGAAAAERAGRLKKGVPKKPESSGAGRPATSQKGKWLALAGSGVAVAAVIAVALLWQRPNTHIVVDTPAPSVLGQDVSDAVRPALDDTPVPPTPPEAETPKRPEEIHISTPTDTERFTLELREDSEGRCAVTKERMQELFPQMKYLEFEGVANLGSDLDAYLSNTYHMARLVGSGGREGSDDTKISYSARNDPDSPRYMLLFSDLTTLCGYAIGVPVKAGEGIWQLEMVRCDYDFSALYQRQAADFSAAEFPPYILAEDLETCGAKYFLYAFNMRSDAPQYQNTQLYFLWNQASSPYLERHLRDISTWSNRLPRGDRNDPQWCYYYLFDENRALIGYTKLSSGDRPGGV